MVPLSKPNVINLCSNLLYDIDQPADDSDNEDGKPTYVTMTDGALEEVQSQEFLTRLDPSERPIDSLAFSLAGTLLHEVSNREQPMLIPNTNPWISFPTRTSEAELLTLAARVIVTVGFALADYTMSTMQIQLLNSPSLCSCG